MAIISIQDISLTGNPFIGVKSDVDEITLTTHFVTLKMLEYKPSFVWWYENISSAFEEYCIRFIKIQEYFGTEQYLSSKDDLGGISYNLLTSIWNTAIVEHNDFVSVNLTLSGLANNVIIEIIIQIYTDLRPIEYSTELLSPLIESQISIIVKNWVYTPGAQGLAIKSEIYERSNNNYVFITNDTSRYQNFDSLIFSSYVGYSSDKAYYNWLEDAGYSNETSSQYPVKIG
ncbi:MAG: hypothetical protein JXA54_06610 [Candidatus Heimdallarchaeota archaeon]|nr:hypothetical protein [Candidatus Heimdallarchaeota archaeon]